MTEAYLAICLVLVLGYGLYHAPLLVLGLAACIAVFYRLFRDGSFF